jgi:hypothetical protein
LARFVDLEFFLTYLVRLLDLDRSLPPFFVDVGGSGLSAGGGSGLSVVGGSGLSAGSGLSGGRYVEFPCDVLEELPKLPMLPE